MSTPRCTAVWPKWCGRPRPLASSSLRGSRFYTMTTTYTISVKNTCPDKATIKYTTTIGVLPGVVARAQVHTALQGIPVDAQRSILEDILLDIGDTDYDYDDDDNDDPAPSPGPSQPNDDPAPSPVPSQPKSGPKKARKKKAAMKAMKGKKGKKKAPMKAMKKKAVSNAMKV